MHVDALLVQGLRHCLCHHGVWETGLLAAAVAGWQVDQVDSLSLHAYGQEGLHTAVGIDAVAVHHSFTWRKGSMGI